MSTTSTHIVLGGNGVAGRETLRALSDRGITPVSLGRNPSPKPDVRSIIADLLDPNATGRALEGADVAYLTAGLAYSARDWETKWPKMLENSINACLANGTLLVYLDNNYAYGRVTGPMTEKNEIRPVSRKGRVRATALRMLDEAASYTPDLGDALVILGTDSRARGRAWHLPTASPALTSKEYMSVATGSPGAHHAMSALTMRIGALFNRSARETLEMSYQYTESYRFDSSVFETTFGMTPTPYEKGIAHTLAACRDARASSA